LGIFYGYGEKLMARNLIKAELLALQQEDPDRILRADQIVKWARRNHNSALHKQFEWDDSKAAAEHRLWQARRLVQINIVSDGGAPMLVSLTLDRVKPLGGYRGVDDVLASKELSNVMLADALLELERVRSRYERIKALTPVWDEVDAVKSRVRRRKVAKGKRKRA
jgi:hypothetical protein